jgi:hypothetical protein
VTRGIDASDTCKQTGSHTLPFGQTRVDARLRVMMPDGKRPAKVSGKKRKASITAAGA